MTQNICGALVPLDIVVPVGEVPGWPRKTFEDVLAPTETDELPAAALVVIIPVVLAKSALSYHVSPYNTRPSGQVRQSELPPPSHVLQSLWHLSQ